LPFLFNISMDTFGTLRSNNCTVKSPFVGLGYTFKLLVLTDNNASSFIAGSFSSLAFITAITAEPHALKGSCTTTEAFEFETFPRPSVAVMTTVVPVGTEVYLKVPARNALEVPRVVE